MIARDKDGKFTTYAWPGGYPVFHLCADGEVICPDCANSEDSVGTSADTPEDWRIVDSDVNWEDPTMYCANCCAQIESAYGSEDDNV